MRLHQEAYGTVLLKPKHHWLLDIPTQLRRDGMVLDAFVIERQHLMVKGVAEHVRNTALYEVSVCSSVLSLQLQETDDDALFDGLIGRTSRLEGFPKAVVANSLTFGCTVIRVGELITRAPDAGFVVACAVEGTALFVIVALTVKVADVTPTAAKSSLRSGERTRCGRPWGAVPKRTARRSYCTCDMVYDPGEYQKRGIVRQHGVQAKRLVRDDERLRRCIRGTRLQ